MRHHMRHGLHFHSDSQLEKAPFHTQTYLILLLNDKKATRVPILRGYVPAEGLVLNLSKIILVNWKDWQLFDDKNDNLKTYTSSLTFTDTSTNAYVVTV